MKRFILIALSLILSSLVLVSCECEHEYGNWNVIIPATCSKSGVKERVCAKCNSVEKENFYSPHTLVEEWLIETESTCLEHGVAIKYCSVCNEMVETKELPCTYHEWIDATCRWPKTCKICRQTSGDVFVHDSDDDKCIGCEGMKCTGDMDEIDRYNQSVLMTGLEISFIILEDDIKYLENLYKLLCANVSIDDHNDTACKIINRIMNFPEEIIEYAEINNCLIETLIADCQNLISEFPFQQKEVTSDLSRSHLNEIIKLARRIDRLRVYVDILKC